MKRSFESWGRFPKGIPSAVAKLRWRSEPLPPAHHTMLPFGLGRSYGDVCQNDGGMLLATTGLDHVIRFDDHAGTFTCEAGMSFAEILKLIVPRGWFLPVTPGTKFVTVGGAIANDIHGKNHHRAGTFGCHVARFELLRSSGERLVCSPTEHADLFRATIGGLGLTGLVTWAEFSLKRIACPLIKRESIRFDTLEEFLKLSRQSDTAFEYTVAWLDATAPRNKIGRGHFLRGNHAASPSAHAVTKRSLAIPCDLPTWALNGTTIRFFNTLYYHRQLSRSVTHTIHYEPFFYPLDALTHWNRLYGKTGFVQYQCVLPFVKAAVGLRELFDEIARSRLTSFLSVLKCFGNIFSPGLLSFPRPGATLALDFRMEGRETLAALDRLDGIVLAYNGRVYPAKDARMASGTFRQYYPNWEEFRRFVDPQFSSSLWRRVTKNTE